MTLDTNARARATNSKLHDKSTARGVSTDGVVELIADIGPGTSQRTRIGREIALESFEFRGNLRSQSSATSNQVAIGIVYDRRPGGSIPLIGDIYTSGNSLSLQNDDNLDRFVELYSKEYTWTLANRYANEGFSSTISFTLDLGYLKTIYKSLGTGAANDIETGALYLTARGNRAPGLDAAADLISTERLRYVDI